MATYAIGDVQGCHRELCALLEKIDFTPQTDRLWLVGDLVNRGPGSLAVLRLLSGLGARCTCVLGNHDLYLLKVAHASASERKRHDTLQAILEAPDRHTLIDWVRTRPLIHCEGRFAMVHAGLLPQWTISQALSLASEVEAALAGDRCAAFLAHLWGNTPKRWHDELAGWDRLRLITNVMTRMRFCTLEGELEFDAKGPPERAPQNHHPWFLLPDRINSDFTLCFGHWSALGLTMAHGVIGLDTGCVWGEKLTAVRLEDRKVFQVRAGASSARKWGK